MHQHEYVPSSYSLLDGAKENNDHASLILQSKETNSSPPATFTFEALCPNLFRTTFTSPQHPLPPHPSVIKPERSFGNVVPTSRLSAEQKVLNMGRVTASINWKAAPLVSLSIDGQQVHQDLPYRSYALDGQGIAHYTHYRRNTLHVGLGDKAAPMDLSNRFFHIAATDCFGYDVYRTDPMYKHIPLLINVMPTGCVAIFSTSHSRATWPVGSEIEGLWGHFKVLRQEYGGLEEYLIVGRNIQEVVRTYADLAGYPRLIPRWAMGYLGGGMKYGMLDSPRSCDAHLEFVAKCKEHDIPVSAFQMSSGYTIAETEPKIRNVFTWNRQRFPDPRDFTRKMHEQGVRLIANVKPYVLGSHPDYAKLKEAGSLFKDPHTEKSAVARLWSAGGGESGEGGHIDFTSQKGFKWWFDGISGLRKIGIDAIWNDNNEICIPDDDWQCSLENEPIPTGLVDNRIGLWGRALHTELMGKSSHDALKAVEPAVRPFVLTRSATAGTMRYAASSWSGDNVTSWEGMKGANAITLNAGMSLLQSFGHDISGFEGPQPSPELLLRWVQLGIHSPRFAINCFKTTPNNNLIGEVIEPWMYPEITPLIRAAIKRRYEIIPYLYSLALQSHITAIPPQRWVGWGYESDPTVWSLLDGENQYWLGDSLMIRGVYEPSVSIAKLYLPTTSKGRDSNQTNRTKGYINLNAPYQHLPAGEWAIIGSAWRDSIPVLAKIGGAIPVGKPAPTACPSAIESRDEFPSLVADDYRGVEIFPPKGSSRGQTWTNTWFEDDGLSCEENAHISEFRIAYWSTETEVLVGFARGEKNVYVPVWRDLSVILPVGDERKVVSAGGMFEVLALGQCESGRHVYKLALS